MIEITADFQSSQNYLMEFLLLDIADLFFKSSYRISCLTVKNHVVEKTGPVRPLGQKLNYRGIN